jgi:endonuclease/exonuclease/phosphatase family metal-dependent hydrolase
MKSTVPSSGLMTVLLALAGCQAPITDTDDTMFGECLIIPAENDRMEIVTWNLHDFPIHGEKTTGYFVQMATAIQADVYALQEISDKESFQLVLRDLPGYSGIIDICSRQNLAFLIKSEEWTEIGSPGILFEDDPYYFPRPPLTVTVTHRSGTRLTLVNVHLKCCEGEENIARREQSIKKLKEYLDEFNPSDAIIILGDFNDVLPLVDTEPSVFNPILADSVNYFFMDEFIAAGSREGWSYPTWPSHIDHMIASNELTPFTFRINCLTPDRCDTSYFQVLSDHRPLLLQLETQ